MGESVVGAIEKCVLSHRVTMKIYVEHHLPISLQFWYKIFDQKHFREEFRVVGCELAIEIFTRYWSTSITKHYTIWIDHGYYKEVSLLKQSFCLFWITDQPLNQAVDLMRTIRFGRMDSPSHNYISLASRINTSISNMQ